MMKMTMLELGQTTEGVGLHVEIATRYELVREKAAYFARHEDFAYLMVSRQEAAGRARCKADGHGAPIAGKMRRYLDADGDMPMAAPPVTAAIRR